MRARTGRLDIARLFISILLLAGLLVTVTPMVYMITTSLRPNSALFEYPPRLLPRPATLTLENYRYVLLAVHFHRQLCNSIIVTAATVVISALASSSLAFCFARFAFPGRRLAFTLVMATMIVPGLTLILPQFELAVALGLTNTLLGLVLFYAAWVLPFSTFMLKGFIEGIPRDFDEAIYMDGGGPIVVWARITVPLSRAAIASVSVLNFLAAWEEYPWAMTIINDQRLRTLPLEIAGFFGQRNFTQYGYVFAMSVLALVPVVAVFLLLQRYFVAGLSTGGLKG